uniref:glycosyltransferase n=1 Tax=Hydrogenophaga sp. TaxID=1904254 RepID=UPI003567A623
MRVGIGSTVLAKGLHSGHIDGIGTYTSELLKAYDRLDDQDAYMPVVFGAKRRAAIPKAQALNGPYSASALVSAVSGLPFLGSSNLAKSIDLFHATDHHIPKLGKTPVIATIMDVIGLRHPEWVNPTFRGLKNRLFAKATTWAESIVTISDFSALDIADCLGVDPRKIESIPLGVDNAYFDVVAEPARQEVRKRY